MQFDPQEGQHDKPLKEPWWNRPIQPGFEKVNLIFMLLALLFAAAYIVWLAI